MLKSATSCALRRRCSMLRGAPITAAVAAAVLRRARCPFAERACGGAGHRFVVGRARSMLLPTAGGGAHSRQWLLEQMETGLRMLDAIGLAPDAALERRFIACCGAQVEVPAGATLRRHQPRDAPRRRHGRRRGRRRGRRWRRRAADAADDGAAAPHRPTCPIVRGAAQCGAGAAGGSGGGVMGGFTDPAATARAADAPACRRPSAPTRRRLRTWHRP